MTGYDIAKKVAALLGYSLNDEHTTARKDRIFHIINRVSEDLNISAIDNLTAEITAPAVKIEALIYGSAMMLAVSESDAGHAQIFAQLYSAKRTAALSGTTTREDVLPTSDFGG